MTTEQLKDLETPAFARAYDALRAVHHQLRTLGAVDTFLRRYVDAEAAAAWRTYKEAEEDLP